MTKYTAIENPLDESAMNAARARLANMAKPLGSLGLFEDIIIKLAGIYGEPMFSTEKGAVVVFCADHGVTAQGVTQTGSAVTAIMARGFVSGKTAVCKMAEHCGISVIAADVGMFIELDLPGLLRHKPSRGTNDFSRGCAMTAEQAIDLIDYGISLVEELKAKGYNLFAAGEMGIGNTSAAAACAAVLLGLPLEDIVGRGAGLSDEGLARKTEVLKKAIEYNKPNPQNALEVLAALGGFELAAMLGLFIGGVVHRVPVIIDGLISSVAALIAVRLCPACRSYMLASHITAEPAGDKILAELELDAPICAELRLGEGTGAVLAVALLAPVLHTYKTMATFDEMQIDEYRPY